MAKYNTTTRFIVNGVDMSSYAHAIEYRMVAGDVGMVGVSLVGAVLTTSDDPISGQRILTISIGEE